jgi:molybdopterin molybdotransferase
MRARIIEGADGARLQPFPDQDSSLIAAFAAADALLVRPIGAPAAPAGVPHPILRLRRL